ncbi:YceI family protein [Chitinophaga japonensis]|uniref:Polyisoprenoid-binding protein YceI n=1 Tax=Chitinophaga japonensis TaxID=104662 RepID=A0A562T4K8_CHIJA|nr:YceI family protein [Chitinophaga japonensis]TWI88477.1 polyisoprenoid-binding protein YceI [Chitinophaga japonensis]
METQTKTTWVLDPAHSEVNFKVKHLMISTVSGKFDKFDVQLDASKEDFTDANVTVTVDTASINTGDAQRDGHLKSADFFEAEKYPQLKFVSRSFKKSDNKGDYTLEGELTIRDVTKTISIPVEYGGTVRDPWGNTKVAFSIDTKINRKEFGLNWNAALETGGVLVGEDIRILADIQLVEQA